MPVGILTDRGRCPSLNAVIRAVALTRVGGCGARVTAIQRGFLGLWSPSRRWRWTCHR